MPYPSQVTREGIVAQAREMIEADGVEALSLSKLAQALGVKAPSLYRHVKNKDALLLAVNTETVHEFVDMLRRAVAEADGDLEARLLALSAAYRDYALAHPQTYTLLYGKAEDASQPSADELEQLALPLQDIMAELSGEAQSLEALRGMWALLHGFSVLEIYGQFQRSGDLDTAFEAAVRAYIVGWRGVNNK